MNPAITRNLIVEFIGTLFLCLVVLLSKNALAIGVTLAIMVYTGAHISGGHFNPAVTFAVFLRGKISRADGIQYWIAQGAGAFAAVLLCLIWRENGLAHGDMSFKLFSRVLAGEILGTFALTYAVLNVATTKALEGNAFYGAAIGLTVFAMASTFDGAAFNPAVALALALSGGAHFSIILTCLVGGSIGAFACAYIVNLLQAEADGRSAPKSITAPSNTPTDT